MLSLALVVFSGTTIEAQSGLMIPDKPGWDSGFDGKRALDHVYVLASDSLLGRYSGFAGADKSDRYIAGHFQQLGLLEPFGADGYFHEFDYGAGEYTLPYCFVAHYPDGSVDSSFLWQEVNIYKYSGFGHVRGRLVFAGYGISAPDKGWDEYANIDVNGAVVLVMREGPDIPGIELDKELSSGYKSTLALERDALGFIMTDADPPKQATITEKYYRENLPAVWISQTLADTLLKSTGKTKEELQKEIAKNKKPVPQAINLEIELLVSGNYYTERPTRNVAGILAGSDPDLRREVVIIGAHMDHHGVDAAGNIYPGADDNASGTATMMELARIFAQTAEKPKRSLMFMGFAAEEEGLVGSKKFVDDFIALGSADIPVREMGDYHVVAMLNMDMVGQGNCSLAVGGIDHYPLLGDIMFADWPDSALKALRFHGLYGGSDHASFAPEGINTYVIGARGDHPNYHTPYDTAGAIKPEAMKAVGDMMFHGVMALADWGESLDPTVSKADYLMRKYGGTVTQSIRFHRLPIEADYTLDYAPVKGVKYAAPICIANLDVPWDETPDSSYDRSILYLSAIEKVREAAAGKGIPFMSDSLYKNWEEDVFTGVTISVTPTYITEDEAAFRALTRLGVGFVQVGVWSSLWSEEEFQAQENRFEFQKQRARRFRNAGVRLITEFDLGRGNKYDEEASKKIANLWHGQIILRMPVRHLFYVNIEEFCKLGYFVLIYESELDRTKSWQAVAVEMLKILNTDAKRQIGIESIPPLVKELVNKGLDEKDIGNLLRENLRRTLARWWANPDYTRVDDN